MDDVDTFSGIFIPADTGIYDIADPHIPQAALTAWLDHLTSDDARKIIRILIESIQTPHCGAPMIGLDAGIPG